MWRSQRTLFNLWLTKSPPTLNDISVGLSWASNCPQPTTKDGDLCDILHATSKPHAVAEMRPRHGKAIHLQHQYSLTLTLPLSKYTFQYDIAVRAVFEEIVNNCLIAAWQQLENIQHGKRFELFGLGRKGFLLSFTTRLLI